MQLQKLRKHYRRKGSTWIPKQSYRTMKEAKEVAKLPNNWNVYLCDICGSIHRGRLNDN